MTRLDVALVERGLARSRSQAGQLITGGRVLIGGKPVTKPAHDVNASTRISVSADPWVSRAAHKLIGALDGWGIAVPPRVLDAGASTGGFTQVVLSRGAERVYAVDVGHAQLAPEVAANPKVVNREGLNLRDLTLDDVDGEPVGLAVGDVSFISLTLIMEQILAVVAPDGIALLLVKPQFEVGRAALGRTGVVKDAAEALACVAKVSAHAADLGWREQYRAPSALPGEHGNIEWFLGLRRQS
ncbi:MAG: TlyA family RNA methyltransferase [Propionibacteriaceae bacterium]|jgi:23S rRNA (cytidine1920-2'-O)/16S rRNA (cytidine1409-2'-O)-methyltransferase|nr:TlyA family RNA methyltransferase [Propionibacteriaceae bacterium]